VQAGAALVVGRCQVGLVLQQVLGDGRVALPARERQRRVVLRVLGVNVGLKLQQALARRQTALASSPVQRRARRHLAVDWHAGCDESHDELGVVGLGCIAKVLVRHGS